MFAFSACNHQHISSNSIPSTAARPHRARRKKRQSSRGKQTTGFTHFFQATALIRSVIKNVIMIWLLSLGIYAVISLPAFLSQNNASQNNETASGTATQILVSKTTDAAPEDQQNNLDSTASTAEEPSDVAIVNENYLVEEISANNNSTDPVSTAKPNNILTISTYKATLFSELDGEKKSQINLTRGDQIQQVKRIGDWLEVKLLSTGATGFIHASQTKSEQ